MMQFTSSREKKYWLLSTVVTLTIFSTLFLGQPFIDLLRDQNIQALIFGSGMLLVAFAMFLHGFRNKPGKFELTVLVAMTAVYLFFFLRLGLAERSHLLEYSVLSILIHKALMERKENGNLNWNATYFAWLIAMIISLLDEFIQFFIPSRVFDYEDIIFNTSAISMALGVRIVLQWIRKFKYP